MSRDHTAPSPHPHFPSAPAACVGIVRVLSGVALLLLFMSCQNSSTPVPPSDRLLTVDSPEVAHFRLDNGLQLLVQEDHRSPVVSVQAWCRAGSITEGDYLGSGISHILEHMLFKGTERRGPSEIAHTVQSIGGYTNAYTSFDRTVYFIDAPSSGWETALDVLADAMFFSTLPEDQYAKEMEVVRREFAMGFDDPERTLQKLLFATAFTEHPYQYPVIGYLENFNRLTRQDVLNYYQHHYVPNNLTFIVAGDVVTEEVRDALVEMTSTVSRAPLPDVFIPREPKQLGKRENHQHFPTESTRFYMAFHIPGITHPDIYALDVLAIVLGQGQSSVLHRQLVEETGWLRQVGAFSYTPAECGLWAVSGVLHANSDIRREEVIRGVMDLLEHQSDTVVSPSSLEKAKRMVLREHLNSMVTMSGKAASLGSSWFVARDPGFAARYLEGIQKVTAKDLRSVARKYLVPHNLTVVSLNPKEAQDLKTGNDPPQSPQTEPSLSALPCGLRWIQVPDDSLPLVSLSATMRGGLLMEKPGQAGISHLTAQLLKKGTQSMDAATLAETIESIGGSLSVQSGNNSIIVTLSVLQPDLERGIELLSDIVLRPAFLPEEIEKEKRKQLSDLQLEKDQPMRVARDVLREALFGSHPYARNTLGSEETVQALTREDIVAFYQNLLARDHVVLSSAGHYDPRHLEAQFATQFPEEAFQAETDIPPHPTDFAARSQTIPVESDKVQAIVQIGWPGLDVNDTRRPALEVIDQALSDIASRLFVRIRDKQSLAYFVGSAQLIGLDPGYFLVYAGTRPDQALHVRDELLDELRLLASQGLGPEEFERARAKLRGGRLIQNQSAGKKAMRASLNVLYGLGIDWEKHYMEQLDALTPEDTRKVAKEIFGGNDYIAVILKPGAQPENNQ